MMDDARKLYHDYLAQYDCSDEPVSERDFIRRTYCGDCVHAEHCPGMHPVLDAPGIWGCEWYEPPNHDVGYYMI